MPFSAIDASVTPQSMQSRFSKPVLLSLHQDRTEPVNLQKKGITMTAIRERHRLLFGRLHTSLTACLVVLVGIGQPVILHAGACEDCEKTKINQLRACNTTLDTDVEKCAVDADTAQTMCISIEQGKIAQAEVDRKSALKNALGAYCITVGFCALLPPPANAGCLYGASGVYTYAICKSESDYNSSVAKAGIERETCDKNCQVAWAGCLKKADLDHAKCVKLANDAYDACKGKCAGPPQI